MKEINANMVFKGTIAIEGKESDDILLAGGTTKKIEELIDPKLELTSTNIVGFDMIKGHEGGMNEIDSASGIVLNIPLTTSHSIEVGSIVTYMQINEGRLSISYSGGATGDLGSTYKKGDVLSLWHKTLDNWVIINKPHALDSQTENEPSGSNQVSNIVSLTKVEYDAGTPIATTLYITDEGIFLGATRITDIPV